MKLFAHQRRAGTLDIDVFIASLQAILVRDSLGQPNLVEAALLVWKTSWTKMCIWHLAIN